MDIQIPTEKEYHTTLFLMVLYSVISWKAGKMTVYLGRQVPTCWLHLQGRRTRPQGFSETVPIDQSTWHHIPKDHNFYIHIQDLLG
jgi:hypothetical protein